MRNNRLDCFSRGKLLAKSYAALNCVHSHRVLLIVNNFGEKLKQFRLRNTWHQVDHLVEDHNGLFAHRGESVLTDLLENLKQFCLVRGAHAWVQNWD